MLMVTLEYFLGPSGVCKPHLKHMALEYGKYLTFLDPKLSHLSNGFTLPTSYVPPKCCKYQLRCVEHCELT